MPIYEFVCQECNKSFILALSIKEYEKKEFQMDFFELMGFKVGQLIVNSKRL